MQENEIMQEEYAQEGAWMQEKTIEGEAKQFPKREKFKTVIEGKELAITKEFQFLNEGKKISSSFGTAILFLVKDKFDNQDKDWFINTKKWSLLKEIKANAPLTGKTAKITRVGKTKQDTRYSVIFLKPEEVSVKKEVIQ